MTKALNKCFTCKSDLNHPLKRYCSRDCKLSPNRKNPRNKVCRQCQKSFVDLDQANRKKVCSETCYILEMKYRKYLNLYNSSEIRNALVSRTVCDVCKTPFKGKGEPVVDHCHETNFFRGLLCRNCNTGMGLLKNPSNMESAARYQLRLETNNPSFEISRIMTLSYNRGWISSKDGNASILKDGVFYITPSGVTKHNINPKDVLKADWSFGNSPIFENDITPSGELLMHVSLYEEPKVRAVLHLHPTYIIAALHRGFNLQDFEHEFPEINRFMRVGFNVPKVPPVSKELAEITKARLIDSDEGLFNIVGQVSHGVCAVGQSLQECFEHIERLEHVCQIVLASGVSPR